ncbi:MAG: phospholipase [Solirubrobacteraceae bacterium]
MGHEHYAARPHPEFLVLEIGDGLGALILHTDAAMHGVEVEISPAGDDSERSHKQVLERFIGGRSAYTAVFDQLPAGRYTLWTDGVPRVRDVVVGAEEVAQFNWPAELSAAVA